MNACRIHARCALVLVAMPLFVWPAVAQELDAAGMIDVSVVGPLSVASALPGAAGVEPAGDGGGAVPREGCSSCVTAELEADCADPIDTINGGCNSIPPVFTGLSFGQELCGTGATYSDGARRDTDWWMFTLPWRSIVTVRLTADYPVQFGLGDMRAGCPIAALLAGVFADGCTTTELTQTLEPGTYVVFVAPQFGQSVICGSYYHGGLRIDSSISCVCPGDFSEDGNIDLTDLAMLLTVYGGAPTHPCMDADANGVVELMDLSSLLAIYGLPCR